MWDFSLFSLIGSSALQLTANNGAFACLLTGIVRLLKTSLSGFIIWVSPCSDCERMPGECDSVCSSELRLPRVVFWPSAHNKHSADHSWQCLSINKALHAAVNRGTKPASASLLKWFLPLLPPWSGDHIPQPIVTFITFHLQLAPLSGSTCCLIMSGKTRGHCAITCLDWTNLNSVKIFQNYVNLAEVRTSHPLTGLHCAGSRNRLICVSNGFLGWLVTPWPHMSISSLVALTLSSDISQPSLTFLCSSRVCPRMFGHQWLLHQARRMQVSIKMFHDK